MKKRIHAPFLAPLNSPLSASAMRYESSGATSPRPVESKAVAGSLLNLCEEIAVVLLSRYGEGRDAAEAVREVRRHLVTSLPCDELRAGQLVDLALELIHVKVEGRFRRNSLELSELIARASNQLRNRSDN